MRARRLGVVVVATLWLAPSTASAVPDCEGAAEPKTILSGQGVLESAIADGRGLFYTDSNRNAVMLLKAPGTEPVQVGPVEDPGGLLLAPDGAVIVGSGNGFANGAAGNVTGLARLLRVDVATGSVTELAAGLSMANGLAWGPAGEIYASDDASTAIDKVVGAEVQRGWASVVSPNGLAVNAAGTHLFAAQTFQPPAIARIDLRDPAAVTTYATGAPEDMFAGLDGMTIDGADRLFVTANGGGQVWRVDVDGSVCALARGLLLPSAVAFGGGGAFPATSLYAVTFSGNVVEMAGARPTPASLAAPPAAVAPRPLLRAVVRPRRVRAGRRVRVVVTVLRVIEGKSRPVRGARVRLGLVSARTGASGRAVLRVRFRRPGRARVRISVAGSLAFGVNLRVLRRR